MTMGKIKSVNLRKILVDELGTFGRGVLSFIRPLIKSNRIPEPIVAGLDAAIKQYEVGIGPKVDRAGTERSARLDHERDDLIQAIKGAIRVAKLRTPEQKLAAQRLEDVIRNRGWDMHRAAYDAESNSIMLMLADIKSSPELQSDSVTVNCAYILLLLDSANNQFIQNEEQRKAKELALGGGNSYGVVKGMHAEIGRVFDYLNSVTSVYPEVASTIDQINLLIDPLAAKIKARATIAQNKKGDQTPPSS